MKKINKNKKQQSFVFSVNKKNEIFQVHTPPQSFCNIYRIEDTPLLRTLWEKSYDTGKYCDSVQSSEGF